MGLTPELTPWKGELPMTRDLTLTLTLTHPRTLNSPAAESGGTSLRDKASAVRE